MISPRLQQGFLFYLLLSALLLAWAMQPLAHAKAIVELQPESVVRNEEVYLSDIALIQGAPANQKQLLGSILIGQSPGHARSTEIRRSYIIAKMKQNLIDMNAVIVKGPEKVKVRSDGTILKGERLVELTQKYILENTGWNKEEVRFRWSRIPLDQPLPPGPMKIDIWKVSGDFYGMTHFRSQIYVAGNAVTSVPMVINIERYVDLVVAQGDLESGSQLTGEDIQVCQRNLSQESARVRKSYCRLDYPLLGKRVKPFVQSGRVLVYEMLADPPIIERGEKVLIEVKRGDVYLTTQGEARASASVGESIPVRSLVNQKIIMARVVRPGTVTVD